MSMACFIPPNTGGRYEADLKKMLPRIPMHRDLRSFSEAGRALAHLHVNYETVKEYPLEEISLDSGSGREVGKKQQAGR